MSMVAQQAVQNEHACRSLEDATLKGHLHTREAHLGCTPEVWPE